MSAAVPLSDAEWAQQLAAERRRRELAEAELARARARLAELEPPAPDPLGGLRVQLETLVQHLRIGLVLVDSAGQIQYVSPDFWQLFGLTPPAGLADYAHEVQRIGEAFAEPAAFRARAWELYQAGETALGQPFALRDGRQVELDYLVLEALGAGRIICYRDVTQTTHREQRLHLLAAVPEQCPNPILRLAPDGEVLYANPAAAPLAAALRAGAADMQPVLALARAAGPGPLPAPAELALADRHFLVTAVPVPDQPGATLYLSDITARHLAEEGLLRQRAFYEHVLEQVPIGVSVFDDEHRYLFLNSGIEPDPEMRAWMLGRTSTETCQRRQRPAASARRRAEAFAEVMRTGRELRWEESFPGPAGERHVVLQYRPVVGLGGTPLVISLGVDVSARTLAERKAVQQQEFYESILNQLPFDVAVFDAEHRFRFVNPAAVSDPAVRQQIIGLTNAEYFRLRQPRHPELAPQREQYFDLAVRTRTDVTWEEMRTDARGRPKLMVRHLRPVFGPDGELRQVVGSGVDITARYIAENLQQQVQEMLREQEAFIRQIVDALPNVLYLIEADGRVSFTNRQFNERIVLSEHLSPEPGSEAVAQETAAMRAFSEEVEQTGRAETRELPLTMLSGERLYYQVYKQCLRRANGQVGILTISTDITEVKRAHQELERREKQYHDLVHYSQALICTHDLQGVLLSVNPAIERLLGWPAAALVGRSLGTVLPPEHLPLLEEYLATLHTHSADDRRMTVFTRAGERRYLHCYSYSVAEPGQPPYVVASGYDVTAGILAQHALEQAKRRAEEDALAKEAFLAHMSHEIRTPLNGVLGMAMLLQKTPLNAQQAEYLDTMLRAGEHLLALVNDVLDMAKISAQHLQLGSTPLDLSELLRGAAQAVTALATAKGLALEVAAPPAHTPPVVGDGYRLQQILFNLLANAIKFTERGRVELGVEALESTPHDVRLHFWVLDTGIGIAPADAAHIFDAFAQATADTSSRFGGTGLGLTISQQLVEQMGGQLTLHSVPDQGSTFSFQLRLPWADAVAEPASVVAPSFEGLRGLRVLLAEDNYVNQWIARVVLEQWGVQVQAVGNGPDALVQLREHEFDAAILDIRMPGLTGVEVTTALRADADPRRARLPIIALTANAFEADRQAYLAAGMNACLVKPYNEADLCGLLLRLARP